MANILEKNSAAYDKLAKQILSRKPILAHILKYSIAEFADCDIEEIEKKYIEGEPFIDSVPLDDTLDISGKNTESSSPNEGVVFLDIIFDALIPKGDEKVKVIINIEPQKTTRTIHYKLMKRAVYYAARLISSQKEKEFHNDNYNDIKKVFSIWVCMDVQNYRADSIQEYKITEEVLHGDFKDNIENYDLFRIVVLNLGKEVPSHKLLNLLHLIFMKILPADEKNKILKDDYNIKISRDMRRELENMGGLMQPAVDLAVEKIVGQKIKEAVGEAVDKAVEKTTKEVTAEVTKKVSAKVASETDKVSKLEAIRNAMQSWGLSAEEAMKGLKISPKLQREFKPLL